MFSKSNYIIDIIRINIAINKIISFDCSKNRKKNNNRNNKFLKSLQKRIIYNLSIMNKYGNIKIKIKNPK